jgi:hypothetical protein
VVALHARNWLEYYEPLQHERVVETTSEHVCRDIDLPPVDNNESAASNRRVPPEVASENRPQFQKTLRKTHMKKHDGGRLVRL